MRQKVDNRGMREINRMIVLDIIRQSERISRTDLARRSALTKPTVSAIVEDLMREGIVNEVGFSESAANGGRPARLLEFNTHSAAYLGVHFGVHTTRVAVGDARGVIRASAECPAIHRSVEKAIAAMALLVDEVLSSADIPKERVQSVGVSVPGLVEQATGLCVVAPHLGWSHAPLRDLLQRNFDVPVILRNEAHAAAVAEGRLGAARNVKSFVWLLVGSGIGSGIVVDGELFFGFRGFGGEIGHCPIDAELTCACGRRGCLETVASEPALAREARAAADGPEPTLLKGWREPLDAEAVLTAAQQRDRVAARILAELGEHLGKGISYLLNILDPEMIVVGGILAGAGDVLFSPLRASVERHALQTEGVRVVPSLLGKDAELTGAVLVAMDHVRETEGELLRAPVPSRPIPESAAS